MPGSLSIPKRRSGDDKWKKLKACDWTSCARFMRRRSFAAVGGISTASNASHALATILVTFKGSPHFLSKAHQVSIAGRVALHVALPRIQLSSFSGVHMLNRKVFDLRLDDCPQSR